MRVLFPSWKGKFGPKVRRKGRPSFGGKEASAKALKPLKPDSKRAAVVEWLRKAGRVDIDAAVKGLRMPSRQHLYSYLINLNRDNGYGYKLENGCVTLSLPGDAS